MTKRGRGIENREKAGKIHQKAKINPNTIWDARKTTKGWNGLNYPTYTEKEHVTDPTKKKEHIANYFKDLYQAREGKLEYKECAEKITAHLKNILEEAERKANSVEDTISTKKEK